MSNPRTQFHSSFPIHIAEALTYVIVRLNGKQFYSCISFPISHGIIAIRWVSVVEFYDRALGIGKVFGQEPTVVKWNYQILGLHQVTVCQKLGVILVNKVVFELKSAKNVFYKKGVPKSIFLNEIFFFIEEYQLRRTFFVKSIFW